MEGTPKPMRFQRVGVRALIPGWECDCFGDVSYSTPRHFARLFPKETGLMPSDYRRWQGHTTLSRAQSVSGPGTSTTSPIA